ncbi:MAG TPA: LamG-like jellyroll fold domain-containing protein [Candidatus Limnocylindria bacterium]|nr:LamG-like jellyroll fold domain-containing protein [Candidatus Limnocylindria bacterium]
MPYAVILPSALSIDTGGPWPLKGSGMTIELWIKPTGTSAQIFYSAGWTFNGITLNPDGSLNAVSGEDTVWSTSPSYLYDGNWHHLAITSFDCENWSVYWNGNACAVKGSGRLNLNGPFYETSPAILLYTGYAAECRLWNAGRTQDEIQANMGVQLTPPQTNLVGLWNFANQTVEDATGTFTTTGGGGFQSTDVPLFVGSGDVAGARVAESPADDGDMISTLLQSFLSGAAKEVGSEGVGLLLNLFGSSQGAELASELDQLETQVTEILADLQNDTNKIISTVNWDTLVDSIRSPIADIDANWTDLLSGLNSSAQLASYIAVGTDLTQIYEAIIPGGVDPTSAGLLAELVAMLLPNAQQAQQQQTFPRFDFNDLVTAYTGLEQYFQYLIGEQIRAITIVVNGITNQQGDPTEWMNTFAGMVKSECSAFLAATEQLAVSYCGDLTALGLLTGPLVASNPIVSADTYVTSCLSPSVYTIVRIWNGNGKGSYPFGTGTSVVGQATPTLTLTAASGSSAPTIAMDATLSATTVFPATAAGQWAVFRYGFELSVPSSGTFTWTPQPFPVEEDGNPTVTFCDGCVVTSAGYYQPLSTTAPQITLAADGTGAAPSIALINVTPM